MASTRSPKSTRVPGAGRHPARPRGPVKYPRYRLRTLLLPRSPIVPQRRLSRRPSLEPWKAQPAGAVVTPSGNGRRGAVSKGGRVTSTSWGHQLDRLVAASIAVSRMSEERADREALAQTLMHPPTGPRPEPDDSIL